MEQFQILGAEIEKIRRDKNCAEDDFPQIAANDLSEAKLPEFDKRAFSRRKSG